MTFVWCPPWRFSKIGRKSPEDRVERALTEGFWLGQTEVTQAQWKQLIGSTPWKGQVGVKDGPDYPATYVSWDEATIFCEMLTEMEREAGRLPPGWMYALPTEAQWEYACRAGTTTIYNFGDDAAKLGDYAWFADNAENVGEAHAHRVGTKKVNAWGLHDMH